jgi:Flp pilus assembly protein TadB
MGYRHRDVAGSPRPTVLTWLTAGMAGPERANRQSLFWLLAVLFAVAAVFSAVTSAGHWYLVVGAVVLAAGAGACVALAVRESRR